MGSQEVSQTAREFQQSHTSPQELLALARRLITTSAFLLGTANPAVHRAKSAQLAAHPPTTREPATLLAAARVARLLAGALYRRITLPCCLQVSAGAQRLVAHARSEGEELPEDNAAARAGLPPAYGYSIDS